ncbi:MAG: hypothetical protein AB7V01_09930, partial [Vicinamibacterales bacterium]
FIPVSGNMKGELFVEAKNLFNNENTRSVNSVVATDTLGNPIAAIPSTFASTNTYQARQVQVGFKFLF